MPGEIPRPRPGRQVPGPVRRGPRRRRHHGRAQRRPDAPHELDNGTLDPNLPPRTARPDADLQPATPAARPARVRGLLQHPQGPSVTTPVTTRSTGAIL